MEKLKGNGQAEKIENNASPTEARADRLLFSGRCFAERHYLPEAVGITEGNDYALFGNYLTQRLVRLNIYNAGYLLSRPGMSQLAKAPLIGRLIYATARQEIANKEVLGVIEEKTQEFLDTNYIEEPDRRHARTIELAVNDLVVRSTVERRSRSIIVMQRPVISDWGERWTGQVQTGMQKTYNESVGAISVIE